VVGRQRRHQPQAQAKPSPRFRNRVAAFSATPLGEPVPGFPSAAGSLPAWPTAAPSPSNGDAQSRATSISSTSRAKSNFFWRRACPVRENRTTRLCIPVAARVVILDGQAIGFIGELHPQWLQKYELPLAPVVFELDLDAL
jgi:phenylalanyl-tRNA synthetase beta subunit